MTDAGSQEAATGAIWSAMLDVYAGAVAGDRARIDAHLDPACTFWDSDSMPLVHGLRELDAVRDARPAAPAGAPPSSFAAVAPEVRVWDGTALLLHVFEWIDPDGRVEFRARNTSVWRWDGQQDRWLMVHDHEDVMAEPYWPV